MSNADKLQQLVLKKVLTARAVKKWDGSEWEEIVITFTDNTTLRFSSLPDCGCEQCDPDGSAGSHITIT